MWINTTTRAVYKLHTDIRYAFPDVSMPSELSDAVIESLGIHSVTQTNKPDGYVVEECTPELVDGVWMQQWVARPPTESEIQIKASEVRTERNNLLSACDWTQTLDTPVNREEWSVYRQQLRDISGQPGFPFEVVWPAAPNTIV